MKRSHSVRTFHDGFTMLRSLASVSPRALLAALVMGCGEAWALLRWRMRSRLRP
jgi:hypothetical protein